MNSLLLTVSIFAGVAVGGVLALAQSEMDEASSVTLQHDPTAPDAVGDSTDTDEAPPRSQEHFSVTTWKIQKKVEAKPAIQLLLPQHNSKFTPGVVTFSWKLSPSVKKKKVLFVLEKLDNKKRATQYWKGDKLSIDLKSGNYRWQISSTTPKAESHWRFFSIIDMKSKSLSKLYDGPGSKKSGEARTISPGVSDGVESEETISKRDVPKVASAPTQDTSENDIAGGGDAAPDDKLEQFKRDKLKAEKEAKDLEAQLEVAKQEHKLAMKAAADQAAKLKAEKVAKLKAQKEMAERLAREEAERRAKAKAEKEEKARVARLRAKQYADYVLAKQKAEKATKKLLAKLNAEKAAKIEAEQAAKELAQKVEAEKQATARIKSLNKGAAAQEEDDDSGAAAPPAAKANDDHSASQTPARAARVPARAATPSAPVAPDDAPKRGDTDTLKFDAE